MYDQCSDIVRVEYQGREFFFFKTLTLPGLLQEVFSDNYAIFERGLEFRPGDIVIDLGANEGLFSILIAKRFPQVHVLSFEPVQRTFFQMLRNLGLNGCQNITPHNIGAGIPGEKSLRVIISKDYSGGSSSVCSFNPDHHVIQNVSVLSLDEIFSKYIPDRCRLLKVDIEGMEYDVLYPATVLDKVDYFVGEFHVNKRLRESLRDPNELATWIGTKTKVVYYDKCVMAD